jgi:hypothetical protein
VDKQFMPYPAEVFNRPDDQGASGDLSLILAKNQNTSPDKNIWLSVSDVAKLGGLSSKTIRRAIENNQLQYRVINNRYQISFEMALKFFLSSPSLYNKLNQDGIGQWIEKWKI